MNKSISGATPVQSGAERPPSFANVAPEPEATVKRGLLLVELAAREAARRKHVSWQRVPAADLLVVLNELGFRLSVEVEP